MRNKSLKIIFCIFLLFLFILMNFQNSSLIDKKYRLEVNQEQLEDPSDSIVFTRSSSRNINTKWTLNNSLINGVGASGQYYAYPIFPDLDNDEDLDLVVGFSEFKTSTKYRAKMKYYENIGTKWKPEFEQQDIIKNDQGEEINFSNAPEGCAPAFIDLDADNDLDLILGYYQSDLGDQHGYLNFFENTGSINNPTWKDLGKIVDNGSVIIDTKTHGCRPALADLDNDGDYDMIVGASTYGTPLLGYRNTGTKYIPEWTKDSNLIKNIIAPGNNLAPTFADLDYDDDKDLVIGAILEEDGDYWGKLYFYNNTGSISNHNWNYDGKLLDKYNEEIKEPAYYEIGPTFADLNGDYDLDLVYGIVTTILKAYEDPSMGLFELKDFKLIGGEGPSENLCYAKYRSYTFNVEATNKFGALDFDYIKLHLDPSGDDVQIIWREENNSYYNVNDPNNYVSIDSKSYYNTPDANLLDLKFKLIFNWNYPVESLENCQISVKTKSYPDVMVYQFQDVFKVENDLEFTGDLYVNAEYSGNLTYKDLDDKWVSSQENITWSGLEVVYEDTELFPPDEEFDVTVWDEPGNHWSDIDSAGRNIIINGKALDYSKEEAIYVVNITGIPATSDITDTDFQLNVDADDIIFYDPNPSSKDWVNNEEVKCEITLEDYRVIDKASIMYRTSINGLENYGDWQSANVKTDNKIIIVSVDEIFEEGIDNCIQWKATDIGGEKFSSDYEIKIDTTQIYFETPVIEKLESDQTYVKFKITISDVLSGVNISSIKYWFSKTGSTFVENYRTNFNTDIINENTIECTAQLILGPEDNNYIKWEAEDKAGNIRDMIFKINLNNTESEINVSLISPGNNNIVTTLLPEFHWFGKSGLTYELYLSSNKDDVDQQKFEALIETSSINNPWYKTSSQDTLTNNQRYYWTVIPIENGVKGICANGIWEFFIDTSDSPPTVTYVLPGNNSDVDTLTPEFEWKIDYSGSGNIFYSFYIGTNPNSLTKETEGYTETTLELDYPLNNFKKYYWRVFSVSILSNGDIIEGTSISGIWNFYVDSSEISEFGVDLEIGIKTIKISQGDQQTYQIKITNTGNVPDIFKVTIDRGHLDEKIISLEKADIPFPLRSNEDITLNLSIKIDSDYSTGDYQVTILVKSINNGSVFDTETVNLEIKGSEERNWLESWGFILVIVIIIIVILIIGFILINKKRKKKEASLDLQPPVSAVPPIQIVRAELIQGPPQVAPRPSAPVPLTAPQAPQQLPTIQPPAQLPAAHSDQARVQQHPPQPYQPPHQPFPQRGTSQTQVGITPSELRNKKY